MIPEDMHVRRIARPQASGPAQQRATTAEMKPHSAGRATESPASADPATDHDRLSACAAELAVVVPVAQCVRHPDVNASGPPALIPPRVRARRLARLHGHPDPPPSEFTITLAGRRMIIFLS